jgi:subtilisin-like proprotein convertase family protein
MYCVILEPIDTRFWSHDGSNSAQDWFSWGLDQHGSGEVGVGSWQLTVGSKCTVICEAVGVLRRWHVTGEEGKGLRKVSLLGRIG